jgi:hypothetical protein
MTKYLTQALREWNLAQPAWKPFVKSLEALPASQQSRIEDRAYDLEVADCLNQLFPGRKKGKQNELIAKATE